MVGSRWVRRKGQGFSLGQCVQGSFDYPCIHGTYKELLATALECLLADLSIPVPSTWIILLHRCLADCHDGMGIQRHSRGRGRVAVPCGAGRVSEPDNIDGYHRLFAPVYAGASESTWSGGLCDGDEHGEFPSTQRFFLGADCI